MKTKNIILIIIGFIVLGCSASKVKTRKETDTNTTRNIQETETKKSTRPGDTLSYTIPNPIFKDTTIYVVNKEKIGSNRLRITYDSEGRQQIECMSDKIDELTEVVRVITENESKKETIDTKEKESMLNGTFIFYIFFGLGGLLVLNKLMNKIT